jgi:hypothetical protein
VNLRVRPAAAYDAQTIAAVLVASWRFGHRGLFPDEVVDGLSLEEREHIWRQTLMDEGRDRII